MMIKHILPLLLIAFLTMQGCEETERITLQEGVKTKNNTIKKTSTNRDRDKEGLVRIVPNKVVLKFKDLEVAEKLRRELLRKRFKVKTETCPCGIATLQRWTLDHEDSGEVEGTIRSLSSDEGAGGVEGDQEFLFDISRLVEYKTPDGALDYLKSLVSYDDNDKQVNIAIIDTGIDYVGYANSGATPFLYPSQEMGPCGESISGWNFIDNTMEVRDDHGHGTAVTKIITGTLDKRDVRYRILPLKVFNEQGLGSYWDVVCAMGYVGHFPDIDIVNASFGFYNLKKQEILKGEIKKISRNTLVMTSAGNLRLDTDSRQWSHFPSGYTLENILGIGGFDGRPRIKGNKVYNIGTGGSNYGRVSIDLTAPYGKYPIEIWDEKGNVSDIVYVTGSSFSTAYSTARFAQFYSENPSSPAPSQRHDFLAGSYIAPELLPYINGGHVLLGP